jgi:hypothetical protein
MGLRLVGALRLVVCLALLQSALASHSEAGRDGLKEEDYAYTEDNIPLKYTLAAKKYYVDTWHTHDHCANVICPQLGASIPCIQDLETMELISSLSHEGWVGLYQDPEAKGPKEGGDSWTSVGCNSTFRPWSSSSWGPKEPFWWYGEPFHCAKFVNHIDATEEGKGHTAWFAAPCYRSSRCICEFGADTSEIYTNLSAALVGYDEDRGWRGGPTFTRAQYEKDLEVALSDDYRLDLAGRVAFSCVILGVILGIIIFFSAKRLLAGRRADEDHHLEPHFQEYANPEA